MKMKILAACLLLTGLFSVTLAAGQEGVSALVQTSEPRQMDLYSTVSGYGTVVPEPSATLNLNFPKAGRVTKLLITPGQQVSHGATLLEIATDPAGTLAYGQAENAVAYARGELGRVQSLYARQLATRSQVEAASKALKDADEALAAQREMGAGARHDSLNSPFDATVVTVAVAPGDRFPAGVNLVQLVRTGFLRARIGIEPEDSRQFLQA